MCWDAEDRWGHLWAVWPGALQMQQMHGGPPPALPVTAVGGGVGFPTARFGAALSPCRRWRVDGRERSGTLGLELLAVDDELVFSVCSPVQVPEIVHGVPSLHVEMRVVKQAVQGDAEVRDEDEIVRPEARNEIVLFAQGDQFVRLRNRRA